MPPRDAILLDGGKFTIATGPHGERLHTTGQRDSQYGDPGELQVAEWRVDGHDFNSFEQIVPGQTRGYLGRDYGAGTDGRWLGVDTLGPLLNTIDLSIHDLTWSASIPETATFIPSVNLIPSAPGVADNANGMAVMFGPSGVPYGYVIRGTGPAKVDLTDMGVKRSGELLSEAASSIVATRSANATREISVGMANTAYRVLTAIAAPPNSDTWATNSSSQVARILAVATDRIVALNGVNNQALGNVLSGSVTMAAPSWATVATLNAFETLRFNGFAVDGALWIIGTSNGPYVLDRDTQQFYPLIDEIDNDDLNGVLASWFPLGVIIMLRDGARYQKGGNGQSIGPTMFEANTSPAQGRPGAYAGSTRWLYSTEYNPATTDTYLIAWRPWQPGDHHRHPLTPHVIGSFTALQSRFLNFIGTVNGQRANATLMGGRGSNAFWMTVGRQAREIDDTAYRYIASGTTYYTELRRQPGVLKDVEAIEFETASCTAARTVTATLVGTVSAGTTNTVAFTAVTTNGFQRQLAVSGGVPLTTLLGLTRVKPQVAFATNVSTAAPQITGGTFRVFYRVRPLTVRTFTAPLLLEDDRIRTAEEKEEALQALRRNSGPVALQDWDRDTIYVRVEDVEVKEMTDRGGGADSARGSQRIAIVKMTEWQTAA